MKKHGLVVSLSTVIVIAMFLAVFYGPATVPPVAAEPAPQAASPHDIYNPARTAIVNAQRQLAESLREEKEILKRVQITQQKLDASLELLASAEQLDPSIKTQIDSARSQLSRLYDGPTPCSTGASSSLDLYRKLLDELQTLIERY